MCGDKKNIYPTIRTMETVELYWNPERFRGSHSTWGHPMDTQVAIMTVNLPFNQ